MSHSGGGSKMSDFWKGVLSPSFCKHHMRARIRERVRVKTNPITEEDFDEPRLYQKVEVWWPTAKDPNPIRYIYLIPLAVKAVREAVENMTEEELKEIWAVVEEYNRNRLEYSRDWHEYLADDEPEALDSDGRFW